MGLGIFFTVTYEGEFCTAGFGAIIQHDLHTLARILKSGLNLVYPHPRNKSDG